MKIKIIIINILSYFFNNNIIFGRLCDKKCCKYDNKEINDEVNKENNNQKNKDDEENNDKKKKDDILKKKREELLKKYNKVNELNKTLPEDKRIDIGYDEKFINLIKKEESLKKISDTLDKEEKDILAILEKLDKKKYEEQLKKTLEDRKKECNNLLKEVNKLIEDNFTKYFKEINIKNDIKIINDKYSKIIKKVNIDDLNEIKKAIGDLDEIKKELNNKKDEIDKLIKEDEEKDKYFCKTKEEFIKNFNERKNELADSFFIDNELKNKLKANNLEEKDISDYYIMYQQMTNDVFNHEISLDLQIYRYILKLEGFTTALDNIFKSDVKLFIPTIAYDEYGVTHNIEGVKYGDKYYFSKTNLDDLNVIFDKKGLKNIDKVKTTKYEDIEFNDLNKKTRKFINYVNDKTNFFGGKIVNETKVKEIEKKLKYINNKLGEIAVDNEKFKYLRCNDKCTNGNNCVSCKLRKLLENEKCLDLFLNIYKQQGEDSNKPEAMLMKRIIYDGLKKDKKYDFYSLNFIGRRKNFCKEISDEFRKCVMIEWALTIEFMRRFIPKYYGSDKFNLYRTFNNIDSVDVIKSDIYESTSLIGNFFIGINLKNINMISYAKSFFTKIENVKYYKCLFNYIISTNENTILKEDSEVEIGFIGIDEKYVENKIVNYKEDDDKIAEKYIEYLEETRKENFDKNLGERNWEEINMHKLK